jgi:hypothetical protein
LTEKSNSRTPSLQVAMVRSMMSQPGAVHDFSPALLMRIIT